MKTLIAGVCALILGILALFYWWGPFWNLIAAMIPTGLILGGALAAYMGVEEWRDQRAAAAVQSPTAEVERYKAEAEKYKKELDELKKQKAEDQTEEEEIQAST